MGGFVLSALPPPKRAWYMWTDAWNDSAARRNPLRWGKGVSLTALVRRLAIQSVSRPLRILLTMQGGKLERDFASPEFAVHWLCSKFDVKAETTSRVRNSLGLGSARSCNESARSADEELMKIAENRAIALQMSQLLGIAPPVPIDTTLCESRRTNSDNLSAHALRVNDEQVCTAKLKYMWADAGILPTKFTLAQANPMRWSSVMAPGELIKDLLSVPSVDRPVKLCAEMPGHREMKTFDNKDAAAQWIREVFKTCLDEEAKLSHDHIGAVCLDAQGSVMLTPCRHAVLCDGCANPILAGSSSCLICHEAINERARGRYADDYFDPLHALGTRVQSTQEAVCDGMYNRRRLLMLTGAALGAGAAACLVFALPAAPVLAGAALAVGPAFPHVYAMRPTLCKLRNASHKLLKLLRSVGPGVCEFARILKDVWVEITPVGEILIIITVLMTLL